MKINSNKKTAKIPYIRTNNWYSCSTFIMDRGNIYKQCDRHGSKCQLDFNC